MDIESLRAFLLAANQAGYANESVAEVAEADGSHTITYSEGDWRFHDNFFGGEPFGGREVVFYRDKPVWLMAYYGRVVDPQADASQIYSFLKKALRAVDPKRPQRGPGVLEEGDWYYDCTVDDIEDFKGRESIRFQGKTVYEAWFVGGLVDRA